MRHPHVLQAHHRLTALLVSEMHVDGFRFDLAASLAASSRGRPAVRFFDLIQVDPVVAR